MQNTEIYALLGQMPPMVLVEWVDSSQAVSQWQWIDDGMAPSIIHCVSVGFLLHDGATEKRIALSLGRNGKHQDQASGVMAIPTIAVSRITVLVPYG